VTESECFNVPAETSADHDARALILIAVLFALVIQRAFWWWKDGMAMPRIVSMLARDSTLYFFM
jgi:hypothetical protein